MHDNPVIVDLLLNILGLMLAMRIGNFLYDKGKKNTGFAASVGLVFISLYCYVAAKYLHVTFRLALNSTGIRWERANLYLFWAALATISVGYFYIAGKLKSKNNLSGSHNEPHDHHRHH
jgi:hypothetical protein